MITGMMYLTCSRAAFSGIIPPVFAWICKEEATMLERIVTFLSLFFASIMAAAVSSQLLSIPKILIHF
jgi:hypothetical protein